VLGVVLPELLPMVGFAQNNPHHNKDVWEHTLAVVQNAPAEPVLRWAALLHDIGKPHCYTEDENGIGHFYGHAEKSAEIADAVMRRLRFDNETRERVLLLVRMHDVVPMPKTKQFSRMRSRYGDDFLFDWLTLVRADRMGQKQALSPDTEQALLEAESKAKALVTSEERLSLATLALRGDDLIALGYRGKEIGKALDLALGAVLDGKTSNEKGALLEFLAKKRDLPIECERKFLIQYPDVSLLLSLGAKKSAITQTYLIGEKGTTARVRCRVTEGKTTYFHTVKRRLTALSAVEEESEITSGEYTALLKKADSTRNVIQKTRYVLPHEGHLLEIDVYPFWQRQAVLEIELKSEAEEFLLPPFITVLREVTKEVAYKNVSLAKEIPSEDKIL